MSRPKRANGAGCIDQVRGKWRVRVWIESKRVQLGPLHETEEQAARALATWKCTREDYVTPSGITLGTLGADWLDIREKHGSKVRSRVRSIATERSAWTRHVATSGIADKPVVGITIKMLEAFALELRDKPAVQTIAKGEITSRTFERRETSRKLSLSSQRHVLRLLRQVFDHAIREELIATNPMELVKPVPGGRRPRDLSDDWLRHEEIGALLVCEDLHLMNRTAYAVAIGTALRKDDLRLLEVARIELDVQVPGPGIRVWVSKSERWHRVPIMPWLVPVLRAHLRPLPAGARYVFSPDPDHMTPYAKGHTFAWAEKRATRDPRPSALETAGVKRRVRFHDLRGTTATHLALGTWGRRWALHEIQQMLAHSDQRVTERYVRRAIDALATAANETHGGPDVGSRWSAGAALSATPPPGIEPGTVRLEERSEAQGDQDVALGWTQRVTNAVVRVEREVADGVVSPDARVEVLELAREHPIVAAFLALADEPDGPHAIRRTIDLLGELARAARESAKNGSAIG